MEPHSHRHAAELRQRNPLVEVAISPGSLPQRRLRHASPPRAVLYPVVILLACLSVVVLLGLASAFATARPRSSSGVVDPAIAVRFYAALNRAIAIGDLTELDHSVWPEVLISRSDGRVWNLADLKRHLMALHAARPRLSLRVDQMVAEGHRGVVAVTLVGAGEDGPLAVPDHPLGADGWTDRFRVAHGRVIEYAGVVAELSIPSRPLSARVVALPETPRTRLALSRLTLQPGAAPLRLVAGGPTLYRVEAGEVHLWHSWKETDSGRGYQLRPGDQALVGGDGTHLLRAMSAAPAEVIAVLLHPDHQAALSQPSSTDSPAKAEAAPTTPEASGARIASLGEVALDLGAIGFAGEGSVAMDRLALPPGRYRLASPAAGAVVLFVESGLGALAAEPGGAPRPVARPAMVLATGSTVNLTPGHQPWISSTGTDPLVLLIVTLAPTAPTAPVADDTVVVGVPAATPRPNAPRLLPTTAVWNSTRERPGQPH